MVAGLIATAAKTLAKRFYPPPSPGEKFTPESVVQKIAGHLLSGGAKGAPHEDIEWGFGALTGAAYGALAEFYPAATAQEGAGFGMAMLALTHQEHALLGNGSGPQVSQSSTSTGTDAASFALYGVVAERIRSLVRKML